MRHWTAVLLGLVALGADVLSAQTQAPVDLRITERGTCMIGTSDIPCSEVGKKLHELRVTPGSPVHLRVDPKASYGAVSTAVASLRGTGVKLGRVNVEPVNVHVSQNDTCLVTNVTVPCSDAGTKLRELGVPLDADIHISGETQAKYETVKSAMDSIRNAGFQLRIGFLTEAAGGH
jgi:biopolymer transport protein ExbD